MENNQTIAVIGLGLMGSSLAMALKVGGSVKQVVGYARSADTVKTALDLHVIDKGTCELKVAVKEADIIVLCTPPATYGEITNTIIPFLKEGAIITDVGSVKQNPTWQILSQLDEDRQPYFVPAHPIAGSEKSGIESKNPDLYRGKQVIITPAPVTSREAVEVVTAMWERCGAVVTEMDAKTHDHIYAEVSHAVQFISYAAITCMDHYGNEAMSHIAQNMNDEFIAFARLGGSSPIMWANIFSANKSYLLEHIQRLNHALSDIRDGLSANLIVISERIRMASYTRREWKDEQAYPHKTLFEDDYSDTMILLIPKIIATILVENTEYMAYAGSGFSDVTAPLLSVDSDLEDLLALHQEVVIDFLSSFCMELEGLQHIINFGEMEDITQELASAQEAHDCLIRVRDSFATTDL